MRRSASAENSSCDGETDAEGGERVSSARRRSYDLRASDSKEHVRSPDPRVLIGSFDNYPRPARRCGSPIFEALCWDGVAVSTLPRATRDEHDRGIPAVCPHTVRACPSSGRTKVA